MSTLTTIERALTTISSIVSIIVLIAFGGDWFRIALNCMWLYPLSSTIAPEAEMLKNVYWHMLQERASGIIHTYFVFDQISRATDVLVRSKPFRGLEWLTIVSYPIFLFLGRNCHLWDQWLMLQALRLFIVALRGLFRLYVRSGRISRWFGAGRNAIFGRVQAEDVKKNQ